MLLEEYLYKIQNEENLNEISGQALMAGLTAGMLAVSAYEAFKELLTKAGRQCFALQGSDKARCIVKMRMEATRKLVTDLEKRKVMCRKAKNTGKCVMQMDQKINKEKQKLEMYENQMKALLMK